MYLKSENKFGSALYLYVYLYHQTGAMVQREKNRKEMENAAYLDARRENRILGEYQDFVVKGDKVYIVTAGHSEGFQWIPETFTEIDGNLLPVRSKERTQWEVNCLPEYDREKIFEAQHKALRNMVHFMTVPFV